LRFTHKSSAWISLDPHMSHMPPPTSSPPSPIQSSLSS